MRIPNLPLRILLPAACLALALLAISATAGAQDRPTVLLLNSYHQGYRWTDDFIDAAWESLAKGLPGVDMAIEYMDTSRLLTKEHLDTIRHSLELKYASSPPDAILSSDDIALQFLLRNHDDLFPGVPVVFCGVNDFDPAMLQGHEDFTGVLEKLDVAPTLELARKLRPLADRVVVVSDGSPSGRAQRMAVEQAEASFPGLTFQYLGEETSLDGLLDRLRALPGTAVVLITDWQHDDKGRYIPYTEGYPAMTQAAPVPCFGLADPGLGQGILGGKLNSGAIQGSLAAGLLLRVLKGEKPKDIPIVGDSVNPYLFDYIQMVRFGISPRELPRGSLVVNEPASFYQLHKGLTLAILAAFASLLVLLGVLAANVFRRRRAEDSMRSYRDMLDAVLKSVPIPLFAKDRLGRYLLFNPAFAEFFRVDPDHLLGKKVHEVWNDKDARTYHQKDLELMEQGSDSIQSYEHRMARSAGEPRDVLFTKACFRDSSGAVAGIVGTFIDITERKQAEQRVLASLHEKEVLLKEIHHRVKNNLQVISSLMNLQCTHVQDPTTVAMFQDCQARIRSMALVHEELYGSEDLARVDMAIYVRKLSGKLFSIFQGARDIERRLSVDNLALPIVTAVPCGLILNELLTNALKHAFQDRERGTVSVAMVKVAHIVTLTVEDDGVGIPPDLDLSAPATFGLRLVVNLVEQLGGSMDLDTAGGTRFLIRFESKD